MGGSKRLTYEQVKEYIESFGYTLISLEYISAHKKLEILCPECHTYEVSWANFQQGYRCPICAGNIKLTYEYIKEQIEKEGYILLSKIYTNAITKMKFQCPEGHKFYATWNSFQQNRRCPECFGTKKLTYEQVKVYIESFEGYKLLSTEYINAHKKLEVQCPEGHIYYVVWNTFQQGHRCFQCSNLASKGEKEVCEYVKSLTREPILENDRTQIVNPLTGWNLELDIYIPSLNKAIEFNCDYWHSGPESVAKDKEKIRQCKEKNIDLLIVDWEKWESCQVWCMQLIKQHIRGINEESSD